MFKCLDFKCLCVGQNIHTNKEQKFQQISYSIVIHMQWYENHNLYETEHRIRFIQYETDSVFRFACILIFLFKRISFCQSCLRFIKYFLIYVSDKSKQKKKFKLGLTWMETSTRKITELQQPSFKQRNNLPSQYEQRKVKTLRE